MIVGVQKGGTTTLYSWLSQHPSISAPKIKELHFFDSHVHKNYVEYEKQFPIRTLKKLITYDATPRYLYFPSAPLKIKCYNPNTKFIVLLRNPSYRAFSAYKMYERFQENGHLMDRFKRHEQEDATQRIYSLMYKNDFPSFSKCVELELNQLSTNQFIEPSIVRRGYYKFQIENYFKYFNKSQFLFIQSEKMQEKPFEIYQSVLEFLNLKCDQKHPIDFNNKNAYEYTFSFDEKATLEMLSQHYKKVNNGLGDLIGKTITWE